ncbi:phage virion morphogenesis protein [uncultured Pantoea sp.]|uniref:phage virion morphogenesis protein n=1 Tax=uncultured Pantoea sp. TaxID=218084 RepID=UPI0035A6CB50
MLREVARDVRRIQQSNIIAQRSLDGTAWEPCRVTARSKKGQIRRGMFAKMKTAKYLKAQASADAAYVTAMQKLARVHHYGLRDRVNRRGTIVKYAERPLLGINNEVERALRSIMISWFTK